MEKYMSQANAQHAETQTDEASPATRRPVDSIRHGNVEIAIWKNPSAKGDFYSASTPTIRYNDNGEWKDGSSFGRHELLDLAEVSREAATEMRNLQQTRSQSQSR
jgi:hypothetical protein